MTIDEAINIAKSDIKYNKSIGCDTSYDEQIADWLEELKSLKENSISKETFEKMKSKAYKKGHRQGYNMAIDDIKEKLMQNGFIYTQHALDVFNEIAEQLKAGGTE